MNHETREKFELWLQLQKENKDFNFNTPLYKKFSEKLILGNKETAALLSISTDKLSRMRHNKEMGYFRIKNRPFHTWPHIFTWLKSQLGDS